MRQPVGLWVPGEPKGQPRPRAFIRGGHVSVYDPGTAEGWKSQIALAFRELGFTEPFAGPVALTLRFFFPRPKSHFRTGKNVAVMRDDAPLWHVGKPDADNVAKAVCDALTGLQAWRDDSQVCRLTVSKEYGAQPGCQITISEP